MKLTPFESTTLEGWEQVYAKAQLSLWIMVAIRQEQEYVEDIINFIKQYARLEPETQSLYRSLRRLEQATLIQSTKVTNTAGPDKKRFGLTEAGENVLSSFIRRNIHDIIIRGDQHGFFNPQKV